MSDFYFGLQGVQHCDSDVDVAIAKIKLYRTQAGTWTWPQDTESIRNPETRTVRLTENQISFTGQKPVRLPVQGMPCVRTPVEVPEDVVSLAYDKDFERPASLAPAEFLTPGILEFDERTDSYTFHRRILDYSSPPYDSHNPNPRGNQARKQL